MKKNTAGTTDVAAQTLSPTQTPKEFLIFLNETYFTLHKTYEDLFWISYMGDHSINKEKDAALAARDAFRANPDYAAQIARYLKTTKTPKQKQGHNRSHGKLDTKTKERLKIWQNFFEKFQTPPEALSIKKKIDELESDINKKRAERKEGYIDPKSKKFVEITENAMTTMMMTHDDEKMRRAAFEAREKLATGNLAEYVELVKLRNEYARALGFADFYDFKVRTDDGMTKQELFSIFDTIYQKTKYALTDIRKLEKKTPGLRKPWNFTYMLTGDFTKEEDPYFQFDEALMRWGRSFVAMGIDFRGGTLQLDLMDRKGKSNNGFCHWPDVVIYRGGKRIPGSANFTCTVVHGQVGSGVEGYETLFHEGGHAAHFLNEDQSEACLNTEYAPMSASWAEVHSMFLDTVFSSIEWRTRYAQDKEGKIYPYDLFQRELHKTHIMRPLHLNGIIFVSNFEKEIYETKNLTKEKVLQIARKNFQKYFDRSEDSLLALNVPHIYSWESTASYHGYGLATLALQQWREYFFKKYNYIVDNPKIGKEMQAVWKLGSSKTFNQFVKMMTGKKLSADAFLRNFTASIAQLEKLAQTRIAQLEKVPMHKGPIKFDAKIKMVHGKKVIADNAKSFEDMAKKYKGWLGGGMK